MKQSVKIIVRSYDKKAGGKFVKLTIGGKFLPLATAEDDVNYQVKFTSKSLCKEPTQEGIYEVAYDEGNLWIDSRPEAAGKNIVRINAAKVVFTKPLPRLEKSLIDSNLFLACSFNSFDFL